MEDDTALVPYDIFQQAVVPWLLHNEKALKRDNYHTIMRALRAFDPEGKGWIDSQVLKASLTTKVQSKLHQNVSRLTLNWKAIQTETCAG